MKHIKRLLLAAVLLYCLVCVALFVWQRQLIYQPTIGAFGSPEQNGLSGFAEATVQTSDGLALLAWRYQPNPGMPTVVLFHGNGGNLPYRVPLLRALARQGFGVVALEYRGYGPNPGEPSEEGLYRDARAAVAFAAGSKAPSRNVILYGESLGTGVAVQLASECDCAALVLQSPFTSMTAVVRSHMPFVPANLLLSERYDSVAKLPEVVEPLLVFHGEEDTVVPVAQGRELFTQFAGVKEARWLPGRGHNDMPADEIAATVMAFAAANGLVGRRQVDAVIAGRSAITAETRTKAGRRRRPRRSCRTSRTL